MEDTLLFARIDPFNYWLRLLVLKTFLSVKLDDGDREFIEDNINKHRTTMWVNVVVSIGVYFGLRGLEGDTLGMLITALLAPVMVMGAAWFAISFGGIPAKLLDTAMSITYWMFTAFVVSFSAMFIAVTMIAPWIVWPAMAVIYYGALVACIQYDTADGLKAGLDEAVLNHSRAALTYYAKQGIEPGENEAGE